MADSKGGEQHEKPRRLEDETAEYLAKIELQFTDDLDPEDRVNLVENVLTEINQRTASASCDRRTNYLIEKLCFAADLKNLLIITRRFTPYAVFLARNRYSSHIMQVQLLLMSESGNCISLNIISHNCTGDSSQILLHHQVRRLR